MDSSSNFTENLAEEVVPPSAEHESQSPEHRISCHRCGNIRKRRLLCSRKSCPHIFCGRCCDKMKDEYGPDIFVDGCPVCKDLCCCSNKSISCLRINHCYRKCPASKNKAACAAYKEEMSQSHPEVASSPLDSVGKSGILNLLAAVADNQLNENSHKRKITSLDYCQAVTNPVVPVSMYPVQVAPTSDMYAGLKFETPGGAFQGIPLERAPFIYAPHIPASAMMGYPLIGSEYGGAPVYLAPFTISAGSPVPAPYSMSLPFAVPSLSGPPSSSHSASLVNGKIIPPDLNSGEISASKPEVGYYRPVSMTEDGYLYDLNGIDGFTKVNTRTSGVPIIGYSFLRPIVPNVDSAVNSSPTLTRRIPFAGTDFPAVKSNKIVDVIQKPTNDNVGGLAIGGNIVAPDKSDDSPLYGSNTNPINILALVSSYSTNIGGSSSSTSNNGI